MKRVLFTLVVLSLVLAACGSNGGSASQQTADSLKVTDGTTSKSYTVADLEKLPVAESSFNDVTYKGVALPMLLQDAGLDPQVLKAVKAVAADGYSVNYDASLFQRQDVLVAYATADGALTADDGMFRMVLPGQEGKMNVRMLTEIQVSR